MNKQIEEMANTINEMDEPNAHYYDKHMEMHEAFADCFTIAKHLYNAGYRKQEWISVEERLPEEFETVLVFCDTGVRTFQCVSEMIEPNGKRWSAVCGFLVTHWMPLPMPPKGDEGE